MEQNHLQPATFNLPRPLKVGFAGTGGIAGRHLRALQEIEGVEVAGICGRSLEKAQALAAKFGLAATAYDDYHKMFEQAGLDAVYITVIPAAHGELERAALERGLALFVEKPLSADPDTAEEIARLVEPKGAVTAVGYQWRYHNTTELAQQLGAIHKPRMALGYWLDGLPSPPWWSKQAQSGGQNVEQTTHIFDLARLLVGEIKQVYALGRNFSPPESGIEVDRVSVVTLEFAGGAIGTISSTSLLKSRYRGGLELISEGLTLHLAYDQLLIDEGRGNRRVEPVTVDPFVLENRAFLEAVAGGPNRIRCDYAEALKTHRVTQAVARSAQENRPVSL
jgi:predicted dehydrogenase